MSPQDYVEIHQLYSRYAWALEKRAGTPYAETFTRDGELRVGDTTVVGGEQLAAFNRKVGKPSTTPTHLVTNILIEGSAEGARGAAYLTILADDPKTPRIIETGTYQDVLVKTPEGWRFKRRTLYLNAMPPGHEDS